MRFLAVVALLYYVPIAKGEICLGPPDFVNTPAGYGHAAIASLGYLNEAYSQSPASKASTTIERATEQIANIKRRTAKTLCAAEVLGKYRKTKNESITAHREAIEKIVGGLMLLDKEWIKIVGDILEERGAKSEIAERISELQTKQEAMFKMVTFSSVLATYIFVDLESGTKRSTLVADLVRTMGPNAKAGMVGGQDNLTAAGGAIYGFLTNKEWAVRP